MPHEPPGKGEEPLSLRAAVDDFITGRLQPKLEEVDKKLTKENDPLKAQALEAKRAKLVADYQRGNWLNSAAKRVRQIQHVTHAIKYSHPNARGSSLFYMAEKYDRPQGLLGSHCLPKRFMGDVVGNAAALDVYKFLAVEYQGRTLLERVLGGDPDMVAALDDDARTAGDLLENLRSIISSTGGPASHSLARQVYFPLPSGGYHLLAPLFPSSLAHALYKKLAQARFSPESKQARQARRDGKTHPNGYVDFPGLATQTFGGSKPQNISQLNAERHGETWLLPSLPPNWQSPNMRPPLGVESVFPWFFGGRRNVRELVKGLAQFLASTDYNNLAIRRARAARVDQLVDQLMQFAAEVQELEPGWSVEAQCRLNQAERLWLDPGRAATDAEFASAREAGDWQAQVADRFGKWLNARLESSKGGGKKLRMDDAAHDAWAKEMAEALKAFREELAHV